jgi:hypothetical protein
MPTDPVLAVDPGGQDVHILVELLGQAALDDTDPDPGGLIEVEVDHAGAGDVRVVQHVGAGVRAVDHRGDQVGGRRVVDGDLDVRQEDSLVVRDGADVVGAHGASFRMRCRRWTAA